MLGTIFDDREVEDLMVVVAQDMRSSQGGIWSGLEYVRGSWTDGMLLNVVKERKRKWGDGGNLWASQEISETPEKAIQSR